MNVLTAPPKTENSNPPQSGAMSMCFSLCLLTPSCFKQYLRFPRFPLPQQSSCVFCWSGHHQICLFGVPRMATCKERSNQRAPGASFSGQSTVSPHYSDCSVCREILEAADKWNLLQQFWWLVTPGALDVADNRNYVSCAGRNTVKICPQKAVESQMHLICFPLLL